MTLQTDLAILLNDPVRAKSIDRIIFAEGRLRQQAYDYIVEVARKAGLGIVRMAALLLKYEDERCEKIVAAGPDARPAGDAGWASRDLFQVVSSYGEEYQVNTRLDLLMLVSELSLLGLKALQTDNDALAYVEEQRRVLLEQLAEVDEETSGRFLKLKSNWLIKNAELRNSKAKLDELMEDTASIRQEFMNLFGKELMAERAAFYRMEVAQRRLQLLKENPGINEADIERMLGKGNKRADSRLSRHQLGLPVGCFVSAHGGSTPADNAFDKARALLRNLATLTHPDKIRPLDLTWNQREQLEAIWHETSPLRAQSSNRAVLSQSVKYLESKLQLAERIVDLSHITDLDVSFVIQGSTIEEQIRWLENANEYIDERIRHTHADNLHLCSNRELKDLQALVAAPKKTQDAERQAMLEKCEAFRKRAEALERQAARLVGACA